MKRLKQRHNILNWRLCLNIVNRIKNKSPAGSKSFYPLDDFFSHIIRRAKR